MNLTSFTDVDVKNEDSMREFLDLNAISHETIYNTLLGQLGVKIDHYPLWTMGGTDQDWLLIHDQEHKSISAVLSLGTPVDLDQVDFNNKSEVEDWLNNHALAHDQISQVLGI